jgi:hypothetical protein
MNKEQAQLRAAEIAANNAAARDAVERSKAAEISPVIADQPVPNEALAESREALKTAHETLNHLQGQRIVAEARIADLAEQRKDTAFQALSGDIAARRRLDECTRATVTAGLDLENIVSAIVEAETRVKQAEVAAARDLDHQRARETLIKVDDLACLAADCDTALRNFLLAYDRFEKLAVAVGAVAGRPDRPIVRVLSQKALYTALFGHKDVFDTRHLAPAERLSFADAAAGWGRAVRFWCHQRLGMPVPKDKAA